MNKSGSAKKEWLLAQEVSQHDPEKLRTLVQFLARRVAERDYQAALNAQTAAQPTHNKPSERDKHDD
jgi:hypothetical protein